MRILGIFLEVRLVTLTGRRLSWISPFMAETSSASQGYLQSPRTLGHEQPLTLRQEEILYKLSTPMGSGLIP